MLIPRFLISYLLVMAIPPAPAVEPLEAALTTASGAYFVTTSGRIFTIRGQHVTQIAALQGSDGRPYHWAAPPCALARWNNEWLVADASDRLARFRGDGRFIGAVQTPFRIGRLAVSADALWLVNPLAQNSSEQLWRTADLKNFASVAAAGPAKRQLHSPLDNLLIVAGGADAVYCSAAIGPPVIWRVWPQNRQMKIDIAYMRSRARSQKEKLLTAFVEDPTSFSTPVRDLYTSGGGVAVLRNREDMRDSSGKMGFLIGQRADYYDASGRQVASAVFPSPMKWIVANDKKMVTAIDRQGHIITAVWSAPSRGAILQ
jgi:hypothetical protein